MVEEIALASELLLNCGMESQSQRRPSQAKVNMVIRPMTLGLLAVIGALNFLVPLPASAGEPTEQVRETVQKVLAIVNGSLGAEAEERKLREVISARFNFDEMAKRSLGSHWRRLTLQEQEEFVPLFRDSLESAYIDRIRDYGNEKIFYRGERVDGTFAEVESRIVPQEGDPISVNYRLQLKGRDWKVYDMVIENLSLVNNYRSQFNRVISNTSYEELVRRLREKSD